MIPSVWSNSKSSLNLQPASLPYRFHSCQLPQLSEPIPANKSLFLYLYLLLLLSCLSHVWLFVTPRDCILPGYSVHRISQARILEWVAISFSWASSWPKDWTQVSCLAGRLFTTEPNWIAYIYICICIYLFPSYWFCFSGEHWIILMLINNSNSSLNRKKY